MDEIKTLKDEFTKLVVDLRAENEAALKKDRTLDEEFKVKVMARQTEIIDQLAELKKPAFKVDKGDVPAPVNPTYTKAFFKWLRSGGNDLEAKALVSNAAGQILLPEELESIIRVGLPQLNVIRPLCTVRTTNRERVRLRTLSAPVVAWGKLELGAAVPNTTLVPTELYQYPEDLNGLLQVGVDELADSDVNLSAFIAQQFTIAMANAEEAGYAIGTGHAFQQPVGIFTAASGITTVNNAAAGAVTFEDVKNLLYALPPQYRSGASFLMHSGTELMLQLLREFAYDATHFAGFMWQPSLVAGMPNTLCGYPVYNCNSILQVAAGALTRVMAFGNFKYGYGIIDREGMTLKQLNELYITSGLIGFLASRRTTGGCIWPDAIRIMIEAA